MVFVFISSFISSNPSLVLLEYGITLIPILLYCSHIFLIASFSFAKSTLVKTISGSMCCVFNNVRNLSIKREENKGFSKDITTIPKSMLATLGLNKEFFLSYISSITLSSSLTSTKSPTCNFNFL